MNCPPRFCLAFLGSFFYFRKSVYTSIDIWTVVAIFCLRLEEGEGAESGLDVGLVEGAVVAVLGEIGVVLGEEGAVLGGGAGETGMG